MKYLLFILLFIIGTILWARFIGTKGLVVKEYSLINNKIPDNFSGMKIVHFSDLHYGSTIHEAQVTNLVKKINELKPDIVVFTGDLIDKDYFNSQKDIAFITDSLKNIEARLGKFAVIGNHDYGYTEFEIIMENSDFIFLNNMSQKIFFNDITPIVITGVTSLLQSTPNYDEILSDTDPEYYHILLAHEPDILNKLKSYSIDLMLSGHTHGGQVRLPFVGTIVTAAGGKIYYEEKYKVGNTDLFISSGIGTSTLKFRLFNKPSINLYRLYKQ